MLAPEIRILGEKSSQAGDVYSYGYILQQLAMSTEQSQEQSNHQSNTFHHLYSIDLATTFKRTSKQVNYYNSKVIPKFIQVKAIINSIAQKKHSIIPHIFLQIFHDCIDSSPLVRPTFEEIKTRLSTLSHQTPEFQLGNSTTQRVVGIYTDLHIEHYT